MTSPARISSMGPPRGWTSPLPSVTYRVWPTAWACQAVRAVGVNRTALTRTREGSSPRAMASMKTSPVNHSAGPLAVGCFGWMGMGTPCSGAGVGGDVRSVQRAAELAAARMSNLVGRDVTMRGAVLYAPGDVRVEERDDPKITEATDAILRLSATCVCGSDLWPYRGVEAVQEPSPMGHEYVGIVQEVGSQVSTVKPGQFVVGSFWASDNTCELCQAGYQSSCLHREPMGALGAQAELLRVPLADGTLVAAPDLPPDDLVPS